MGGTEYFIYITVRRGCVTAKNAKNILPREKTIDAITLIADILKEHNVLVLWENLAG